MWATSPDEACIKTFGKRAHTMTRGGSPISKNPPEARPNGDAALFSATPRFYGESCSPTLSVAALQTSV